MNIQLKGSLAFYGPKRQSKFTIHLEQPTPLAQVLERIRLPAAEVYLVVVNDSQVDPDQTLVNDDDTLSLFPPTDGG
jgi:molybdopterin converting factor small subunit